MVYHVAMDEAVIDDLKQFITATVSQATADMATKADLEDLATKADLAKLETKLEARIDIVDEKLDVVMQAVGERLDDHEQRLTKLEVKTA